MSSSKKKDAVETPSGNSIFDLMASFGKIKDDKLFAHQRFAVDHLVANPRKSALICYAMGTGKTAIVAEYTVKHFNKKVVYMGPKSLHPVFKFNVTFMGGDPKERLAGTASASGSASKTGILHYSTITSEASNVYEQMIEAIEPVLGKINPFDRRTMKQDDLGEPIGEDPSVLVIMDECHIFSARVAKILSMYHYSEDETKQLESAEKQAYKLYRLLCRDPRIRIIAMTGTPIKTHPFNLVPIANIVRKEFASADGRRSLAFPEVFGRFHDSFVREFLAAIQKDTKEDPELALVSAPPIASPSSDTVSAADSSSNPAPSTSPSNPKSPSSNPKSPPSNPSPTPKPIPTLSPLNPPELSASLGSAKNTGLGVLNSRKLETFSTRLRGLVLWYEAPKGLPSVPFPVVESEEYVSIPMKGHQWKVYRKMEEDEARIEQAFRKNKPEHVEGTPRLDDPSVYRSLTRQASNFAFPEDLYIGSHRSAEEMLSMMPPEAFQIANIGTYSCKIERIVKSIADLKDRIHGVFSSFVHGAGLAVVEKCLDALGWKSLNDILRKKAMTFEEVQKTAGKGVTLYMSLTGETQPELKERLISVLNQPENTKTLLVRTILYSGAAAHGLTFKSGRVIHFLEPEWDDVEEAQARDRFIRINAANFLPPDQRKIKVYYYLAVHPDPTSKEETTDQHLRKVAERKALLNSLFLAWLKCTAVDCEGMYHAENTLHAAMIANGQVPPLRVFFRCVSCEAKYIQSYFLQELTDNKCKHVVPTPPNEGVITLKDEKVILDRKSGLGWTVPTPGPEGPGGSSGPVLLLDAVRLRGYWTKVLTEKKKS